MINIIILLVILISINGLFSSTELAFLLIDKYKIKLEVKKGNKKAIRVLKLINSSDEIFSTIQIVITLVTLLASAFASQDIVGYLVKFVQIPSIPIGVLDSILIVIVTILISYFTLLFGELVPKRVAMNYPYAITYIMAMPITIIMKILYPFVKLLTWSTNIIIKILHIKEREKKITEDDIIHTILLGNNAGILNDFEKEYMLNIFEFGDTKLEKMMTSGENTVMLEVSDDLSSIVSKVRKFKFSRYPVYDKETKEILGILNIKDILLLTPEQRKEIKLNDILRDTIFFNIDSNVDDAFRQMQKEHISMAIVMKKDAFAGIITLEDAIEEIIGNIYDEHN